MTRIEYIDDGSFQSQPWVLFVIEDGISTPIDWFETQKEAEDAANRYDTAGT